MSSLRVNNRGVLKDICSHMLNTDDEVYLREVGVVIEGGFKERFKELKELRAVLKEQMKKVTV